MAVHVIVVVPDHVQRDFGLFVILDHVFHDGQIPVAPAALVKPCNSNYSNQTTLKILFPRTVSVTSLVNKSFLSTVFIFKIKLYDN